MLDSNAESAEGRFDGSPLIRQWLSHKRNDFSDERHFLLILHLARIYYRENRRLRATRPRSSPDAASMSNRFSVHANSSLTGASAQVEIIAILQNTLAPSSSKE